MSKVNGKSKGMTRRQAIKLMGAAAGAATLNFAAPSFVSRAFAGEKPIKVGVISPPDRGMDRLRQGAHGRIPDGG